MGRLEQAKYKQDRDGCHAFVVRRTSCPRSSHQLELQVDLRDSRDLTVKCNCGVKENKKWGRVSHLHLTLRFASVEPLLLLPASSLTTARQGNRYIVKSLNLESGIGKRRAELTVNTYSRGQRCEIRYQGGLAARSRPTSARKWEPKPAQASDPGTTLEPPTLGPFLT